MRKAALLLACGVAVALFFALRGRQSVVAPLAPSRAPALSLTPRAAPAPGLPSGTVRLPGPQAPLTQSAYPHGYSEPPSPASPRRPAAPALTASPDAARRRAQDLASSQPRMAYGPNSRSNAGWQGPGLTSANPPRMPPAGSVTSAPPGFTESPWGQRNPLIEVFNADRDTMVLDLSGPAQYQLVVGPFGRNALEVLPGTYAASVWSELASEPNTGWGVFRAFRRYSAAFVLGPADLAPPLSLGELSGPGEYYR